MIMGGTLNSKDDIKMLFFPSYGLYPKIAKSYKNKNNDNIKSSVTQRDTSSERISPIKSYFLTTTSSRQEIKVRV